MEQPKSNSSNSSDSVFHYNYQHDLQIVGGVLHPFFIEFLTIFTGCLMELWTRMTSLNAYDRQNMMVQINRPSTFSQNYESCTCTSVVGFENSTTEKRKLKTYIITIISIITAILYLCSFEILQSGPLAEIANRLDASTRIILFRVIQFAVFCSSDNFKHNFHVQTTKE